MPYLLHVQVSSTFRSEPVAIYRFPEPIPSEVQRSFSEIFGHLIASDRVLKLFVIPLSLEPITLSLNSSIWLIWILDAREGLVQALNRPARPPTGLIRPPRPVRRARGAKPKPKKSHGEKLSWPFMAEFNTASIVQEGAHGFSLGSDARHVSGRNCMTT